MKTLLDHPEPAECRYPVGALKNIAELEPFDCRYPVAVEASECGRGKHAFRGVACLSEAKDVSNVESETTRFGMQLFCAEPCAEGKPYCTKHLVLCYRPTSHRQTTEDRKLARAALRAAAKNSREKV